MENSESIQILIELLRQGGMIIAFLGVLWVLAEKDRRKIIKLLHQVIHLVDHNGNGKEESNQNERGI